MEEAMIVDLPSTSTAAIGKQLVQLRNEVGALALGRVLTLIVVVDDDAADEAVEIATEASRQHPCRIIVVISGSRRGANRIDGPRRAWSERRHPAVAPRFPRRGLVAEGSTQRPAP
jgi:hypothetical protein